MAIERIKPGAKSWLLISCNLIAGLVLAVVTEKTTLPGWLSRPVFAFLLFLALNLLCCYFFKLDNDLTHYWHPKKLLYFFAAALAGLFIALCPPMAGLLAQQLSSADIKFNAGFSAASLITTFIIVSWEELWFRGIYLNYCRRHLPAIAVSVGVGFLFMLIHILNPSIQLLQTGPALFFAGTLLTLLYFYYETIWVPLGLHFGNNIAGSLVKNTSGEILFFGNDGYFSAIVLAVLVFIYAQKTKKKLTL